MERGTHLLARACHFAGTVLSAFMITGALAVGAASQSLITADRFAYGAPVVVDVLHYDADFLFAMAAERNPISETGGPYHDNGLFVHSRKHSQWLQIIKVSTAGASFREACDTETWLAQYAKSEYVEPQLRTVDGWRRYPHVQLVPDGSRYQLSYCKTVLHIVRTDLQDAFTRMAEKNGD